MVTWCRLSGDSDQKSHIAVGEPFLFHLVELRLEPRRLEHEHVGRFLSIRRIELEDIPRHALLELRARSGLSAFVAMALSGNQVMARAVVTPRPPMLCAIRTSFGSLTICRPWSE